jgi:hypothetical protein
MSTTAQTVPTGPYWGFTLTELETEQARLIADRKALSVRLQGSSVNGQSFQFAVIEQQRAELDRRQLDLQAAFYYLDPGRYPLQAPTDSAAVAFI